VEWTVLKAIVQCKFKIIPPIYTFNLACMLTQTCTHTYGKVCKEQIEDTCDGVNWRAMIHVTAIGMARSTKIYMRDMIR